MFDIILGGVILVVFVLIGIDVTLNIQNKLRERRTAREMRKCMHEFVEAMESMEKEMSHAETPVRKIVVKPVQFKSAKVKLPKDFGKLEDERKVKQRNRMRAYRAKKRKSAK